MNSAFRPTLRPLALLALMALAGLAAGPATAALGDNAGSVGKDALHFHSKALVAHSEATWTMQEIQSDAGTTIHEYLTTDGTVFAVAWSGPAKPDLRQLLGNDQFEQIRAAANTQAHSNGQQLDLPGLSYQVSGRMPNFHGKAWLTALLPAGFTADQIN